MVEKRHLTCREQHAIVAIGMWLFLFGLLIASIVYHTVFN